MLKKFSVENFRGFKNKIEIDFSAKDYEFNKELINNKIVSKILLYGKNGVGKSSLGIALFDIIFHLTDKEKRIDYYLNYRNLDSSSELVKFSYTFQFGKDEVIYQYSKRMVNDLVEENLMVNNKNIIKYNFFDKEKNYIEDGVTHNLNIDLIDNKLSIIKYIYKNTPTDAYLPITKLVQFCEKMLWYRSLSKGNEYFGYANGGSLLCEKLYESGKLREFVKFLEENGLKYKLNFELLNGVHELIAYFDKGKALFTSVASTGTMALFLYFIWSITAFNDVSLLFIDEFDAFFHYESAENIIKQLNKFTNIQAILTSHNTYLMQNKFTRPDCCYIMTENKITNLSNATDKEIREAHNLEKMYVNGAFDV